MYGVADKTEMLVLIFLYVDIIIIDYLIKLDFPNVMANVRFS